MGKTNEMSEYISSEAFEQAAARGDASVVEVKWRGLKVCVRKYLSFKYMLAFVKTVVENCFIEDSGEYIPAVKDSVSRIAVVEYYSNITLPDDFEQKHDLVYGSDIVSVIYQYIDLEQLSNMLAAIDAEIEYRVGSNMATVNLEIRKVMDGLTSLEEQASKLFEGIDGDTISKVAGAIADGKFDEAKLVDAMVQRRSEAEAAK